MRTLKLMVLGFVAVALMVGAVGVATAQAPTVEALMGRQYPGFFFVVLTADNGLGTPTVTPNLGVAPLTFQGATQTTWLFFGSTDVLSAGATLQATFSSTSKSAACQNFGPGVLCL